MSEVLAIVLISGVICGVIGRFIARNKGVSEQQGFAFGFFLGPFGLIIVALLNPSQNARRVPVSYGGVRDVGADRYRLWLTQKYDIQHNSVLDRYVVGPDSFSTRDEAMEYADRLETSAEEDAEARAAQRAVGRKRLLMLVGGGVVAVAIGLLVKVAVNYFDHRAAVEHAQAQQAQWQKVVAQELEVDGIPLLSSATMDNRNLDDLGTSALKEIDASESGFAPANEQLCGVETSDGRTVGVNGKQVFFLTKESPEAVSLFYQRKLIASGYRPAPQYKSILLAPYANAKKVVLVYAAGDDVTHTSALMCVLDRKSIDKQLKLGLVNSPSSTNPSMPGSASSDITGSESGPIRVTSAELEEATDWNPAESRLIAQYRSDNEICRGAGDAPGMEQACERREQLAAKLRTLGVCYGHRDESGFEMGFHRCDINSN